MSDIATLARRIDAAADPDAYFGTLAFCLERCHGDLPVASDLAEIAFGELQFDASFESRHPRHGDGRFRPHSNSGFADKKGHRQKIQGWEKGVFKRAGEAEQRESPLPKTAARGVVEKALEDPQLMADLTQRARRLIGRDLQSAIDPEDVVQSAVMHGLKGADAGEFESHEDAAGWLHSHVAREARFMGRGLRAFKRRGAGGAMSLDEELDVAERAAESAGVDAAVVLGRAIAALDDDDRKVFVAYYGLDGQPPRGRDSQAIVKSRIGRIKAKLRGHLAEQAMSGSRQDDPSPPPATDEGGRMAEAGAGKGKSGGSLYQVRLADKLDELGRELKLSKKQLRAIKAIAAKRGAEQFAISLPSESDPTRFKVPEEGSPEDAAYWDAADKFVDTSSRSKTKLPKGRRRTRKQPLWRIQGDPIARAKQLGVKLAIHPNVANGHAYAHSALDELERLHATFNIPRSALTKLHIRPPDPEGGTGAYLPYVPFVQTRLYPNEDIHGRQRPGGPPGIGGGHIGSSFEDTVAHEHGHSVHAMLPFWQKQLWSAVNRGLQPGDISDYGSTEDDKGFMGWLRGSNITGDLESFAEAFSAYTHPSYSRGSLPENVERFFDFVISKQHGGRLPPDVQLNSTDASRAETMERNRWIGPTTLGAGVAMKAAGVHGGAATPIIGKLAHQAFQRLVRRFRGLPSHVQERMAMHAMRDRRTKDKGGDTITDFLDQLHSSMPADEQHQQFDDSNSVDSLPDHITSVGHRAAIGAMDAARSAIRDLLKKNDVALDSPDLFSQIERILNEAAPALSQTLAESTIAAHVRGVDDVLKLADLPLPSLPPPNVPPGTNWLFPDSEEPPIVRFPVLEFAARRILKANVMAPDDFYRLAAGARDSAFTVSGDLTQESVAKIRDALYENMREGPDSKAFARDVDGLFEEGMPLSRAHLEQVFRNNVNGAWSDGHDKALSHELIADAFPYRAYTATHDQRVRDEHLILEHTGLSGTNIYLASDPVFQTLRPPWSWSCRCSFYPVSIAQAARKGVEHAQRWLEQAKRLGVEPEQTSIEPEHVDWPTLNGERIMPPPQWQRGVQFAINLPSQNMRDVAEGTVGKILDAPYVGRRTTKDEEWWMKKAGMAPKRGDGDNMVQVNDDEYQALNKWWGSAREMGNDKHIASAVAKGGSFVPVMLYRGDGVRPDAGDYIPQEIDKMAAALRSGGHYEIGRHLSFTTDYRTAKDFRGNAGGGLMLRLVSGRGLNLTDSGGENTPSGLGKKGEREVIVPAGSKVRILGIQHDPHTNSHIVTAMHVPDKPAIPAAAANPRTNKPPQRADAVPGGR